MPKTKTSKKNDTSYTEPSEEEQRGKENKNKSPSPDVEREKEKDEKKEKKRFRFSLRRRSSHSQSQANHRDKNNNNNSNNNKENCEEFPETSKSKVKKDSFINRLRGKSVKEDSDNVNNNNNNNNNNNSDHNNNRSNSHHRAREGSSLSHSRQRRSEDDVSQNYYNNSNNNNNNNNNRSDVLSLSIPVDQTDQPSHSQHRNHYDNDDNNNNISDNSSEGKGQDVETTVLSIIKESHGGNINNNNNNNSTPVEKRSKLKIKKNEQDNNKNSGNLPDSSSKNDSTRHHRRHSNNNNENNNKGNSKWYRRTPFFKRIEGLTKTDENRNLTREPNVEKQEEEELVMMEQNHTPPPQDNDNNNNDNNKNKNNNHRPPALSLIAATNNNNDNNNNNESATWGASVDNSRASSSPLYFKEVTYSNGEDEDNNNYNTKNKNETVNYREKDTHSSSSREGSEDSQAKGVNNNSHHHHHNNNDTDLNTDLHNDSASTVIVEDNPQRSELTRHLVKSPLPQKYKKVPDDLSHDKDNNNNNNSNNEKKKRQLTSQGLMLSPSEMSQDVEGMEKEEAAEWEKGRHSSSYNNAATAIPPLYNNFSPMMIEEAGGKPHSTTTSAVERIDGPVFGSKDQILRTNSPPPPNNNNSTVEERSNPHRSSPESHDDHLLSFEPLLKEGELTNNSPKAKRELKPLRISHDDSEDYGEDNNNHNNNNSNDKDNIHPLPFGEEMDSPGTPATALLDSNAMTRPILLQPPYLQSQYNNNSRDTSGGKIQRGNNNWLKQKKKKVPTPPQRPAAEGNNNNNNSKDVDEDEDLLYDPGEREQFLKEKKQHNDSFTRQAHSRLVKSSDSSIFSVQHVGDPKNGHTSLQNSYSNDNFNNNNTTTNNNNNNNNNATSKMENSSSTVATTVLTPKGHKPENSYYRTPSPQVSPRPFLNNNNSINNNSQRPISPPYLIHRKTPGRIPPQHNVTAPQQQLQNNSNNNTPPSGGHSFPGDRRSSPNSNNHNNNRLLKPVSPDTSPSEPQFVQVFSSNRFDPVRNSGEEQIQGGGLHPKEENGHSAEGPQPWWNRSISNTNKQNNGQHNSIHSTSNNNNPNNNNNNDIDNGEEEEDDALDDTIVLDDNNNNPHPPPRLNPNLNHNPMLFIPPKRFVTQPNLTATLPLYNNNNNNNALLRNYSENSFTQKLRLAGPESSEDSIPLLQPIERYYSNPHTTTTTAKNNSFGRKSDLVNRTDSNNSYHRIDSSPFSSSFPNPRQHRHPPSHKYRDDPQRHHSPAEEKEDEQGEREDDEESSSSLPTFLVKSGRSGDFLSASPIVSGHHHSSNAAGEEGGVDLKDTRYSHLNQNNEEDEETEDMEEETAPTNHGTHHYELLLLFVQTQEEEERSLLSAMFTDSLERTHDWIRQGMKEMEVKVLQELNSMKQRLFRGMKNRTNANLTRSQPTEDETTECTLLSTSLNPTSKASFSPQHNVDTSVNSIIPSTHARAKTNAFVPSQDETSLSDAAKGEEEKTNLTVNQEIESTDNSDVEEGENAVCGGDKIEGDEEEQKKHPKGDSNSEELFDDQNTNNNSSNTSQINNNLSMKAPSQHFLPPFCQNNSQGGSLVDATHNLPSDNGGGGCQDNKNGDPTFSHHDDENDDDGESLSRNNISISASVLRPTNDHHNDSDESQRNSPLPPPDVIAHRHHGGKDTLSGSTLTGASQTTGLVSNADHYHDDDGSHKKPHAGPLSITDTEPVTGEENTMDALSTSTTKDNHGDNGHVDPTNDSKTCVTTGVSPQKESVLPPELSPREREEEEQQRNSHLRGEVSPDREDRREVSPSPAQPDHKTERSRPGVSNERRAPSVGQVICRYCLQPYQSSTYCPSAPPLEYPEGTADTDGVPQRRHEEIRQERKIEKQVKKKAQSLLREGKINEAVLLLQRNKLIKPVV